MSFNSTEELIADLRDGKMILLIDDEDRENEGDLVLAADFVTPQAINFMALEARGLICLSLSSPQIERLQLPQMVRDEMNLSPNKTAFTVSIEAATGVSTGISAADRAHTVRVAANPHAKPSDVHMPGHIFPIKAQPGGVLKRAGHTEGSVDLARLAGLNPAAVICEVMNPDGSMARVQELKAFAKKHAIKIGTIVDLIEYRLKHESLIEEVLTQPLPEKFGNDVTLRVFKSKVDGLEHIVLQKGEPTKDRPTLARVHVDNFTREFLNGIVSQDSQVLDAWRAIEAEGEGLLVVLRGANKPNICAEIKSLLVPEEEKTKTLSMDDRDYGIGAQILRSCGAQQIRLLSNRPEKRVGLKAFNLEIIEVVALDLLKTHHEQESAIQNEKSQIPKHKNITGSLN